MVTDKTNLNEEKNGSFRKISSIVKKTIALCIVPCTLKLIIITEHHVPHPLRGALNCIHWLDIHILVMLSVH